MRGGRWPRSGCPQLHPGVATLPGRRTLREPGTAGGTAAARSPPGGPTPGAACGPANPGLLEGEEGEGREVRWKEDPDASRARQEAGPKGTRGETQGHGAKHESFQGF